MLTNAQLKKRRIMYGLAVTHMDRIKQASDSLPRNYRDMSLERAYAAMGVIDREIKAFIRDVHALGEWE